MVLCRYWIFFCLHPSVYFLVSWAWWDWPLTWLSNHCPSVLWHCWLGHLTRKIVPEMIYNVLTGTLNPTIPYQRGHRMLISCVRRSWRSCMRCWVCTRTRWFSMMNSTPCSHSLYSTTPPEVSSLDHFTLRTRSLTCDVSQVTYSLLLLQLFSSLLTLATHLHFSCKCNVMMTNLERHIQNKRLKGSVQQTNQWYS